jgi:hypothetical protein
MPIDADLCELKYEIKRTEAPSPQLMARFTARACRRLGMPGYAAKTARIHQLVEVRAWTEAAMALVELELPQWKLRRLVCEEGVWLCSLTKQSKFPDWLADLAESRHAVLPLAILAILIEARRSSEPSAPRASSVPQCGGARGVPTEASLEIVCCDNFA